ncbi:hypothetical protein M514_26567 [Trichuris suis]|uniref:Uncharacterized protein n=1 Tax=Trichuris suis TaxID=68888 RepID=A0A085MVM3_9BILA|nr:hypothetical protein M514_26567 [Trichuris suis]
MEITDMFCAEHCAFSSPWRGHGDSKAERNCVFQNEFNQESSMDPPLYCTIETLWPSLRRFSARGIIDFTWLAPAMAGMNKMLFAVAVLIIGNEIANMAMMVCSTSTAVDCNSATVISVTKENACDRPFMKRASNNYFLKALFIINMTGSLVQTFLYNVCNGECRIICSQARQILPVITSVSPARSTKLRQLLPRAAVTQVIFSECRLSQIVLIE